MSSVGGKWREGGENRVPHLALGILHWSKRGGGGAAEQESTTIEGIIDHHTVTESGADGENGAMGAMGGGEEGAESNKT